MSLTVKENGVRVANGSLKGTRVNANQIRTHYAFPLLGELGFVLDSRAVNEMSVYVHSSTEPHSASSLCVVWIEYELEVLSIRRGHFVKNRVIGGEYDLHDLHDFVSEVIQSVREVWIGGSPNKS